MDTSQMIAREFENHALEHRRGPAAAFDMNMSLLSNSALSYSIPYGPSNISYTTGPGPGASMASYGSIMPPQTLYLPSYAINQNISQIRHIPGSTIQLSNGPLVKAETKPLEEEAYMYYDMTLPPSHGPKNPGEVNFGTDVDTLMRAIQVKSDSRRRGPRISEIHEGSERRPGDAMDVDVTRDAFSDSSPGYPRSRKKYQCSVPSCSKVFFQKTHLEIHVRAHTGAKPFLCKEPTCGQRFSQLGNLKTHERRHTGERPYSCDHCGKRFAQRGNVRAHKIVHEQIKPFLCKLENCGKQFTQLGNLKSHQNKFHSETLRNLTQRFASMREGDPVTTMDKDLWEYFATLYKNSNKGIKGRGKDRRISAISRDGNGGGDDDKQDSQSRSSSSGCSGHDTSEASDTGKEKDDSCNSSIVESDDHEHSFANDEAGTRALTRIVTR